ncbi:MAG TPA: hypothetical protein VHS35_16065 [Pseudonocardia sp.]|jgi:hypothetical protein|nr:hypothetical protein [Pseudonocardia sp.]
MSVRVAAATAALSLALALAMAGSALAAAPDVLPTAPPAGAVLIAPGPAVGTTPPHAR